jgi:hypothetical protein
MTIMMMGATMKAMMMVYPWLAGSAGKVVAEFC